MNTQIQIKYSLSNESAWMLIDILRNANAAGQHIVVIPGKLTPQARRNFRELTKAGLLKVSKVKDAEAHVIRFTNECKNAIEAARQFAGI
jgi:hypothetical protein